MTFGSALLGLALVVLVGLYLARPLFVQSSEERQRESRYNDLLALKESYMIQLRNLDFDFQTGKIPEEVYQQQRSELMSAATEILKEIDSIEAAAFGEAPREPAADNLLTPETNTDSDIEAAVLRLRRSHRAPRSTGNEVEKARAGMDSAGIGETKFCPQCGKQTDPDDKFCVNCGAKLRNPQPV